nr:PREDICTED: 39S ribosomal protein L18, mitochondrial [Bemisia tabaci]
MNFFPSVLRHSVHSRPLEKLITPIVGAQKVLHIFAASVKTPPTYSEEEVPKFISPIFTNRNPRNLERLTIGDKPEGWNFEKPGRRCWNRLEITESSRYVTARVVHHSGRVVLSASTAEWPLKKRLHSYLDQIAYETLGKVFAIRCLECGIDSMLWPSEAPPGGKLDSLLTTLKNSGINLDELPQYKDVSVMAKTRPDKPGEPEE